MSLPCLRCISFSLWLLLVCVSAQAAPEFPTLTGRVVDAAGMISAGAEREIAAQLGAHEAATTNQVVVVTLNDLQGYSIEDFGYQLARHWGIGQKDKNNGVLLIVAKAERKVRIEVGYGLEGDLTDAIASNIIATVITPAFKAADFDGGIAGGVTAIVEALGGEYKMREMKSGKRGSPGWGFLFFILVFFIIPSLTGRGSFFSGLLLGSILSGGRGRRGGFGRGGFGGGGFGGGGGGFGGGGASGGW